MKIKITCTGSGTAKLEDLQHLQGKLKYLNKKNFDRLLRQIKRNGFSAPFFVTEIKGKKYLIDGHQRHHVMTEVAKDPAKHGVTGALPEEFPVVDVKAKTLKEAKEKLLAITSQYGKIRLDGLDEFMDNVDFGPDFDFLDNFNFDAIDLKTMFKDDADDDELEETTHNDDKPPAPADLDKPLSRTREETITCPSCRHQFKL